MQKSMSLIGLVTVLQVLNHLQGVTAQIDQPTGTPVSIPLLSPPFVPPAPPASLNPPPPDDGRLPGGPNGGLVEYVAMAAHNTVPGFVVPNTQFGVPYVEFTASEESLGQTATFQGAAEVAVVINGVVQYPFRPNKQLSPECQVVVNFKAFRP